MEREADATGGRGKRGEEKKGVATRGRGKGEKGKKKGRRRGGRGERGEGKEEVETTPGGRGKGEKGKSPCGKVGLINLGCSPQHFLLGFSGIWERAIRSFSFTRALRYFC